MVSLIQQGAGLGVESVSPQQLAAPFLPSPLVLPPQSSLTELQPLPPLLSFAFSSVALPAMGLDQVPLLSVLVEVA